MSLSSQKPSDVFYKNEYFKASFKGSNITLTFGKVSLYVEDWTKRRNTRKAESGQIPLKVTQVFLVCLHGCCLVGLLNGWVAVLKASEPEAVNQTDAKPNLFLLVEVYAWVCRRL